MKSLTQIYPHKYRISPSDREKGGNGDRETQTVPLIQSEKKNRWKTRWVEYSKLYLIVAPLHISTSKGKK